MTYSIQSVEGKWWSQRGWAAREDRWKYDDLLKMPYLLLFDSDWCRAAPAPGGEYVNENRETIATVYAERG